MEQSDATSFSASFVAGLLTFLSPCILSLIPAYISYMTGISFDELKDMQRKEIRKKTLIHSLLFAMGFSLIFMTLGASASLIGRFLIAYRTLISRIGGVLVIFFGLYIAGFLKLDFLNQERRIKFKLEKGSKFGSVFLGVTFAAAWTPCAGPVLGSILMLAATQERVLEGALLLSIYSLGIALPFVLSALLMNSFLSYFAKLKKYMFIVKFICGIFLILIGVSLIRGSF